MRTTHDTSVDGRRLIHVVFEQESPDADAPTIEVVYELRYPEDFTLDNQHAKILIPLSATRRDTREPYSLTREEADAVHQVASAYAAELTSDSWEGRGE